MEKLRIAMLGHKRCPSREGGVEIVVEELATRMAAMGYSVTCFNRAGHHVSGKEFDWERGSSFKGVALRTVPTIRIRGLAAVSSSITGAVLAALGNYDVVHFHAEGPCAMLWFPKLFGRRCVCTVHGLDWKRAKWGRFARAYIMLGERCAAKYADEIIVLSKGTQKYFMDTYGRSTVFIPNGVDRPVPKKAELITREYGLEKGSYLLFLGRLVPEKGLRYLIDAYKQVKTEKKLVIAGGSSDTEDFAHELRQMAADDPRILFAGFVQGQMLEELYSNAYLYLLPSDVEGMPLSLLEAMSYGNCCVVSDIEECTSVVEEKAVTFAHGDVPDLRDKMQKLCDDTARVERYQKDAAAFICGKYNWDRVTQQTLEVYMGHRRCRE